MGKRQTEKESKQKKLIIEMVSVLLSVTVKRNGMEGTVQKKKSIS